ncbi:MAG TPA: hypothetical protein VKA84_14575 [Gemmatimonadaceae bacterium]|nr:hypothetical protein [Gemmatimonadaceae bacterium]
MPALRHRGIRRTLAGTLFGANTRVHFDPQSGLRWTSLFSGNLYVEQQSTRACSACGLVWTQLSPEALRDKLRKWGTDATRAWLDGSADQPLGE